CAEGVEKIDLPFCLDSLKQYAEQVRQMTDELLPQFELRSEAFNGSPAYFRMLVMATVLQRDLGIRPDASLNGLNDSEFFGDPGNLWLQGLLQRKKGTCSNLPILYVAVGRRLGYPLKLVRTAHHLFARWDEPDGE